MENNILQTSGYTRSPKNCTIPLRLHIMDVMFLPTTREEMDRLGWNRLDVILVTGDSYIDSPFMGIAVIGRVLQHAGYRVGVIAQPDLRSDCDIRRLGEPELFWGISGGSVDSMVANYTSLKKKRRTDDYTPGGLNERRPDRATIAYTNLVKRYFKSTRPIVLGGIEASLRRIAHYDYWSDRVRGSVLLDAKADYLLYGMAEKSVIQLTDSLKQGQDPRRIPGLCYISNMPFDSDLERDTHIELPPYDTVARDKRSFIDMFHTFYRNSDPLTAKGMYQRHGIRYLVHNPPPQHETQAEMDGFYALDFERAQHPYYEQKGRVRALETVRFSIATHRGCYGGCNFCAIAVHEGRTVRWRSPQSVVSEAKTLASHPDFKGNILDLGGPTANMYGFECDRKLKKGACLDRRCLHPDICPSLRADHSRQLDLLRRVRKVPGVKKVFISSGIRYDLLLSDKDHGLEYLQEVVQEHVSGQMKVAPEHTESGVLKAMGKPGPGPLLRFKKLFDDMSREAGKEQFLTYYFIAAHPGCTEKDMQNLKRFASRRLNINPRQVQVFMPAPSTYSSTMYYTGLDPFTDEPLFVDKGTMAKERQKEALVSSSRRQGTSGHIRSQSRNGKNISRTV